MVGATMILKRYGEDAAAYLAERLGTLAAAGDVRGVETWQLIALRIDQLIRPGSTQ